MPRGAIPFPFGSCRVCNAPATGNHYGANTCEGCKGFFKRSLGKHEKYKCLTNGSCPIDPENRIKCKLCRFKRCLELGMSMDAIKMGRIPKLQKQKALEKDTQNNNNVSEAGGCSSGCSGDAYKDNNTFIKPSSQQASAISCNDDIEPPVSKVMKTASEYMRSRSTVNHINMELSGNSGESNADGLTRSITQRHITHRQLSHQGGNNHNKRSQHFLTRRHSSAALSERNRKQESHSYNGYPQMPSAGTVADDGSSMVIPNMSTANHSQYIHRIHEDGHDMVQLLKDVISINDSPSPDSMHSVKPPLSSASLAAAAASAAANNTNYARSLASAATTKNKTSSATTEYSNDWYHRASLEDLRLNMPGSGSSKSKLGNSAGRQQRDYGGSSGYHSISASLDATHNGGSAAFGYTDDEMMGNAFLDADDAENFLSHRDDGRMHHATNMAATNMVHSDARSLLPNTHAMFINPATLINSHLEPLGRINPHGPLAQDLHPEIFDSRVVPPTLSNLSPLTQTDHSPIQPYYQQSRQQQQQNNNQFSDSVNNTTSAGALSAGALSAAPSDMQSASPHHSASNSPISRAGAAPAVSSASSAHRRHQQQQHYHSSSSSDNSQQYNSASPSSSSSAAAAAGLAEYHTYTATDMSSSSNSSPTGSGSQQQQQQQLMMSSADPHMLHTVTSCHSAAHSAHSISTVIADQNPALQVYTSRAHRLTAAASHNPPQYSGGGANTNGGQSTGNTATTTAGSVLHYEYSPVDEVQPTFQLLTEEDIQTGTSAAAAADISTSPVRMGPAAVLPEGEHEEALIVRDAAQVYWDVTADVREGIKVMEEVIASGSTDRMVPFSQDNLPQLWKWLMESVTFYNNQITKFCMRCPLMAAVCDDDKAILIKHSYISLWLIWNAPLFKNGQTYIPFHDTPYVYTRNWMEKILPDHFVEYLHEYARRQNTARFSISETALLCALALTPCNVAGVRYPEVIAQVHEKFRKALVYEVKKTRLNPHEILNEVPQFLKNLETCVKKQEIILGFDEKTPPELIER